MEYIDKIGIELEGGWPVRPDDILPDASVVITEPSNLYTGEVVSKPYRSLFSLKEWYHANYPPHINNTCGLHVHFSFLSESFYSKLMDETFKDFFIQQMEAWGKSTNCKSAQFWERIRGNNSFCKLSTWHPEVQAAIKKKYREDHSKRYGVWNFCYGLHKTAECRVLPMFTDKDYGWLAINQVINLVDKWLDDYKDSPIIAEETVEEIEI